MLFPKDFPEKLRSTILTSEVVGKKVKLKQRGKEFQGLCPFHNEKTPSFTVNDAKGFYHCFGCSAHGDIISFVMNNEGLDYKDAVNKLANDFSIEIPKVKVDEVRENKLDLDYLILEKAAKFFEKNLHEGDGSEARNYLKKRRLNSATAKKFRLGFSKNSYDDLINYLTAEGYGDPELARTGIIGKNERGKLYAKFRGRVMFPITDKKNRVIAFGGRTLGDDLPKYLNSSETEIFKKNQTLYNFFNARKSVFDKGYAVVVEGYMDAIALANAGIENVVAGLGTALGVEHLKELFYTTDKIVICLDGDSAGIRAAKRVSEISLPLITAKKNISFAFLPNKMDPDDFVKEFGAKELENLLQSAIPLSESLIDFAMQELGIEKNKKISAENKARLEANLFAKTNLISDAASKKHFARFFNDALYFLGSSKGVKKTNDSVLRKVYVRSSQNISENIAKNILAFVIKFPQLATYCDDIFDMSQTQLTSERMTILKDEILNLIEEGETEIFDKISSDFVADLVDLKNMLARFEGNDLDSQLTKFRILLLKDLLLQVEEQYREALSHIDEISTHPSAITDQKIKEIFDYRNSLQVKIMALEKDI